MQKIDLDKRNSFGTLDWLESWNEPSAAKLVESKINELVDAVNKLQNRIDPPSAYEVMGEKDAIIARHIGEKNRLREALETAKYYLMKIGHLNMSEHGLGSNSMMIDWCKAVALDGVKKIKPVLEQKEEDDDE